ncbi:two-component system sensor kinase [Thermotomaculum hydrothermale]|uniref:histidine kinase n=1 Tax=Thermotomaculum hydrothermale TaxID=981385 RepID=A0A7R6SYF0_9BACT|nr:ATP-binding protein [Thermotomaculum hydrothermale]BBB32491.1 two-component system sensor kinase [Thermotomaculum hydrothermale]
MSLSKVEKNSNKRKVSKKSGVFLIFISFAIVLVLFLFFYFYAVDNKAKHFVILRFQEKTEAESVAIKEFMQDGNNFLYFTKKYLEREFENYSYNKLIDQKFKEKYVSTSKNKVSNYKYVLSSRKNRREISASYLNKNEVLNEDIKIVTLITEKLDVFWKKFLEKYPFVHMTYVDKSGFYREFPFRKIEPNNIGFLSDPRNYPYYIIATTIAKDEIFLTNPYQNGSNLYISLVVPVYKKNEFKGLLTIDVSMNNFVDIVRNNRGFSKENIDNLILFDNKGNIYAFYIEDKQSRSPVSFNNLKEMLKNQQKLLTKNLKIYPLITNKKLINYLESFLNNKHSGQKITTKIFDNYVVSLSSVDYQGLNILRYSQTRQISNFGTIDYIRNGTIIVAFIFVLILSFLVFLLARNNLEKKPIFSLVQKLSDKRLREKIFSVLNSNQYEGEDSIVTIVSKEISDYLKEIDAKFIVIKTAIENVNIGILVVDDLLNNIYANKWFKQLIVNVNTVDLMPEELKTEIQKFNSNNSQQFQKMIKLFERHYLLSGEKININLNSEKKNLLLFTLTNAEEIVKMNKKYSELKSKIAQLEENLNKYHKSFENLNTRIIQSDKFAVFGELIQGIVHNINNPLMIVTSRLSMVKSIVENLEDSMDKKRLIKHMDNIISSVQKINQIIESVLTKARMTVEKEERLININEVIKSELEFFNADLFFKHKVKKEIDFDNNLPLVRISQSDFSQVLHNLIKNALDALKSSVNPTLSITTKVKDQKVIIEIADNGPGVPDKYREKIFEQYFTTKGSHGTGIGLYNARKIIEEYEGQLVLDESDKGARFIITLPAGGE